MISEDDEVFNCWACLWCEEIEFLRRVDTDDLRFMFHVEAQALFHSEKEGVDSLLVIWESIGNEVCRKCIDLTKVTDDLPCVPVLDLSLSPEAFTPLELMKNDD